MTLACLAHVGRSTAVRCEEEIAKALLVYGINIADIAALVTDTDATMTLLGRLVKTDHHYCLAHLLELVTVRFYL
jgi:F420-0:gamma-glutamyl ligase-like protein